MRSCVFSESAKTSSIFLAISAIRDLPLVSTSYGGEGSFRQEERGVGQSPTEHKVHFDTRLNVPGRSQWPSFNLLRSIRFISTPTDCSASAVYCGVSISYGA